MSASIRVVAHIRSRPETVMQLRDLLQSLLQPTRAEPGCLSYELYQNRGDATDFTFIEEWRSDADIDAHFGLPHVLGVLAKAPELLAAQPDIRRYDRLA